MAATKRRKAALLLQHLEGISWRVLEVYPEAIREFIRRRSGVYALYRRRKLYYVGLASNLMGRLRTHLRDRHHGAWDRFSVYLTVQSDHMKELESLLLRIAGPEGNRVSGRLAGSIDQIRAFNRRIIELDAERRARLLGGVFARGRRVRRMKKSTGQEALRGVVERQVELRGRYKGVVYKAHLRADGTIRYSGKIYPSPSAAGRAILKRSCNGWYWWKYRNDDGDWVRLRELRR